jgi:hypothetical protein
VSFISCSMLTFSLHKLLSLVESASSVWNISFSVWVQKFTNLLLHTKLGT